MTASKKSSWTSHALVKSSTSIPLLFPVGGSTCSFWYALASLIRNELECVKPRVSITDVTKNTQYLNWQIAISNVQVKLGKTSTPH